MAEKKWTYNKTDNVKANELAMKINITPLLAKVLISRGLGTPEQINKFLHEWKNINYSPFLMKDMDRAVKTITEAVEEGKRITVYGDYDCDGITSTAILTNFLKYIGAKVDHFIPDRLTDGYGISCAALDKIAERGTQLVITVDCGISAGKEIEYINKKGIETVVTDHHQCSGDIPAAKAVVNPHRPDCEYPFKGLAGVGVAYKLIQAICENKGLGEVYKKYIDLVTLGTIADVVSLSDENRQLVSRGLESIDNTENIGLKTLIHISGTGKYKITTQSFAFSLAPRLNATGRMGNAEIAVQLVLAEEEELARELAFMVEMSNRQRQYIEGKNVETVLEIIDKNEKIAQRKVIVVAANDLHHGVVGIVSSRITERYNKPSIILVKEERGGKMIARGSARSIKGISMFKMLTECKDILLGYGGHELAAGLSIECDKIEEFADRLDKSEECADESLFSKYSKADILLDAKYITADNVDSLSLMEPFGQDNEEPVFISENLLLKNVSALGEEGKHLKMFFTSEGTDISAIAFNRGKERENLKIGCKYDVVYNLENNVWNDKKTPQMRVIDIFLS